MFREANLERLTAGAPFDVLVIGGGVNGAATFRDLSLNGIATLLLDTRDFCAGASSASSRMAHGGLRYLEGREFRLVRESTRERNRLLVHAPHLVRPFGIVVPVATVVRGLGGSMARFFGVSRRPASALSLATMTGALTVYDAMGRAGRVLPGFSLSLRPGRAMPALRLRAAALVRYHDGLIESPEGLVLEMIAEGVAANPRSAALNHVAWDADGGAFRVRDTSGAEATVAPKVVVNAAGSAIDAVNRRLGLETRLVRPVKGAHLVLANAALTNRLGGDACYFDDGRGRMVIMVPLGETVLMGTTEIDVDAEVPEATAAELDYLLAAASSLFDDVTVTDRDIVAVTVGSRPLQAGEGDPNAARRDHLVARHPLPGAAHVPVLSLVGGKWTTFRAFGEEAANAALATVRKQRTVETGERDYPGAVDYQRDAEGLAARIAGTAWRTGIDETRAAALWRRYGSIAEVVSDHCAAGEDAPLASFPDMSRREIGWLVAARAAVRLDDLVLRRTNLVITGRLSRAALSELADAMADALGHDAAWAEAEAARCAAMPTILFQPHCAREMAA